MEYLVSSSIIGMFFIRRNFVSVRITFLRNTFNAVSYFRVLLRLRRFVGNLQYLQLSGAGFAIAGALPNIPSFYFFELPSAGLACPSPLSFHTVD